MDEKYIELASEFTDFEDNEIKVSFQFKKPTTQQVSRANKEMSKAPERAFKNLLLEIVHEDQRDDFKKVADEYPGVVVSFADEIYKRIGYGSLGK
jgi:isopropylmalate/homocitrate/citramalate synthase